MILTCFSNTILELVGYHDVIEELSSNSQHGCLWIQIHQYPYLCGPTHIALNFRGVPVVHVQYALQQSYTYNFILPSSLTTCPQGCRIRCPHYNCMWSCPCTSCPHIKNGFHMPSSWNTTQQLCGWDSVDKFLDCIPFNKTTHGRLNMCHLELQMSLLG